IAAGATRGGYGGLEALDRLSIDQGTHERRGIQRIADAHLVVGVDQAALQVGGHGFVDEDAAGARAALAGGADGAEDDRRNCEIQIRGLIDRDRVVASELEEALAHAGGDALPDLAADGCGAGEGDQGDAAIVDETSSQLGAAVDEELEDRGQATREQDAVAELLYGDGGEWGLRGGLPDRDVAADRSEESVPGPNGNREVEGGEDADHSERMPLLVHPMPGALGMHGEAVEHA